MTGAGETGDRLGIPGWVKAAAGISVLIHAAILAFWWWVARLPGRTGVPTSHLWDWYLVVGATWSVGVGLFGLFWGDRAVRRGLPDGDARVGYCMLGVWLGYLWPVPVAAAIVTTAWWRPRRRRPLRLLAPLVAAAVLVGGWSWWTEGRAARFHRSSRSSEAMVGTWHEPGGPMTIVLRADGTYSASGIPAPLEAVAPAGSWSRTEDGYGQTGITLWAAEGRWDDALMTYSSASADLLCAQDDLDAPCDLTLLRVAGP